MGDHPAVITGMVQILAEQENIHLDEVAILHTEDQKIRDGSELIEYTLSTAYQMTVMHVPLNFTDPVTQQDCYCFLQIFYGVLEDYEQQGYEIYVSLAGGRKNTSALMAILCQLFPSIKALYHLIDKEDTLYTTTQLYDMADKRREQAMHPDLQHLELVRIPYQPSPQATVWRQKIATSQENAFYETLLESNSDSPPLSIYLSQAAMTDYDTAPATFDNYLRDMAKPQWLKMHQHAQFEGGFETDCRCLKKGGRGSNSDTGRPFYYQEGNKLIVARLTSHGSTYERLLNTGSLYKKDHPPVMSLNQFRGGDTILLVPLGDSPMVATQTYTLLQKESEAWESRNIAQVVVVYPQQTGTISNGVEKIRKAFKKRRMTLLDFPIEDIDDVDSTERCEIYLEFLQKTIDTLRTDYPEQEVVLSLSGGRKGMSVLTLFAAQKANIAWVYHTLITDPTFEQTLLEETNYNALNRLSTKDVVSRLFLERYQDNLDKFTLLPIPVISFD